MMIYFKKAVRLTGTTGKTVVVRQGLEALIALESARRLAALGGTDKNLGIRGQSPYFPQLFFIYSRFGNR